jgi:hypothetical protein
MMHTNHTVSVVPYSETVLQMHAEIPLATPIIIRILRISLIRPLPIREMSQEICSNIPHEVACWRRRHTIPRKLADDIMEFADTQNV